MISSDFLMNYFTHRLLQWASTNLRDYPWRKNRSCYKVYISEVFLQRTKADQVRPIYEKFVVKYPDYQSLYQITPYDLIMYFKPLGLVKRKEIFWKAIQQLKEYNKPIEELSDSELIKLKGIGDYSFHAIRCFGQNSKHAIVDSNVIRIFQRFFDFQSEKKIIFILRIISRLMEI